MSMDNIEYFFDLSKSVHQELFAGSRFVWDPLKKISSYLKSKELGNIEGIISAGVHLENPEEIFIGKNTVIEAGAYIKGPCYIGSNCEVRSGAYIRGNVILSDESVVGHATEVKNSILLNRAHAAHFNYVGDSILGKNSNLGAGMICANLRLDQEEVCLFYEGKKILTGLKKLGLILGDDSQIGCNCVSNPGTVTGKKVFSHACLNIKGFIPSGTVVKSPVNLSLEEK